MICKTFLQNLCTFLSLFKTSLSTHNQRPQQLHDGGNADHAIEQHLEEEEIIQIVVPKGGAGGDMIQVKVDKETFYTTVPQGLEVIVVIHA